MNTRVSLGLGGLGVTVLRRDRTAADVLLTARTDDHGGHSHTGEHKPTLLVPKRHYVKSTIDPIREEKGKEKDFLLFDVRGCDIRFSGMPSGAVAATRGLREVTGGKRDETPRTVGAWRDVTWVVDFDVIEGKPPLVDKCLAENPPDHITARVHLSGGRLEAGLPRHRCLRAEVWEVRDANDTVRDVQTIADTMYHSWDMDATETVVDIRRFDGTKVGAVTLTALGGAIAGVLVQSVPLDVPPTEPRCGEGTMDHHGHLYGILKDRRPGHVRVKNTLTSDDPPPVVVDENRRCGRGLVSE